ncbi:MAG: hypothetical protein QW727_01560 [Candidatus Pacearchaeota archaeon]
MFLIIHILFGALIGLSFNSWIFIIPLCILSHFIIDMIPHWDGSFNKYKFHIFGIADLTKNRFLLSIFDIIISLITIIILLHYYKSWKVILASIISISPDILNLGYLTKLKNNKYYMIFLRFHSKIQREIGVRNGLIIQGIILIILIFLLTIK